MFHACKYSWDLQEAWKQFCTNSHKQSTTDMCNQINLHQIKVCFCLTQTHTSSVAMPPLPTITTRRAPDNFFWNSYHHQQWQKIYRQTQTTNIQISQPGITLLLLTALKNYNFLLLVDYFLLAKILKNSSCISIKCGMLIVIVPLWNWTHQFLSRIQIMVQIWDPNFPPKF